MIHVAPCHYRSSDCFTASLSVPPLSAFRLCGNFLPHSAYGLVIIFLHLDDTSLSTSTSHDLGAILAWFVTPAIGVPPVELITTLILTTFVHAMCYLFGFVGRLLVVIFGPFSANRQEQLSAYICFNTVNLDSTKFDAHTMALYCHHGFHLCSFGPSAWKFASLALYPTQTLLAMFSERLY